MTACGGGLVRGQPPLIGISTVKVQQQEIQTRVDIYNPNGVDMEVDTIEMSMILGEIDLGTHSDRLDISVHPNGTEEISFDFPPNVEASQILNELEQGEINSVPYVVSGQILAADGGNEVFSQQGYLYPVPGRSGEFRGAGPQRDQPRER